MGIKSLSVFWSLRGITICGDLSTLTEQTPITVNCLGQTLSRCNLYDGGNDDDKNLSYYCLCYFVAPGSVMLWSVKITQGKNKWHFHQQIYMFVPMIILLILLDRKVQNKCNHSNQFWLNIWQVMLSPCLRYTQTFSNADLKCLLQAIPELFLSTSKNYILRKWVSSYFINQIK